MRIQKEKGDHTLYNKMISFLAQGISFILSPILHINITYKVLRA